MAQTGYTPILIYSSSTGSAAPTAGNLTNSTLGSELAINITDGKLFYKDNANAVQVIAWKVTPTTAGGTGLTSYTAGDTLYYAAGSVLSKLGIGASKTIMTSSGTAPQWSISLDTSQGGTGLTSYTAGDLTYYASGTALTKLAIGANTYILTSNGTAPTWAAPSAVSIGTATNLAGGAQGSIPYQSAAATTAFLAKDTNATRYLANTGTNNNPAWAQINLANGVTGVLPVANGGTNASSASITAFNNITGYTASGATGTTSTNLVFSTSPTLTTPIVATTMGVGGATAAASGSGITFPASASASSDANTLDDYEEGTWTPIDSSGAGLTFTTAAANYTKIGRAVYWQAVVQYPTTASGLDTLIGGLPFTPTGGSGAQGRAGSFITATDETTLVNTLQMDGTTTVRLYKAGLVRSTNAEMSGNQVYFGGFFVV